MHLQKFINTIYKKHPKKPIVTSSLLDSILPIARPKVLKDPKQKRGHLSKRANKRGKS